MSSFHAIAHYNPLIVFLLGIATLLGWVGFGMALLKLFRLSFPAPWRQVLGALLGIQTTSLAIQLTAMAGLASPAILTTLWIIITLTGVTFIACIACIPAFLHSHIPIFPYSHIPIFPNSQIPKFPHSVLPALLLLALLTSLLSAIAPSSKIDELYYHMILPSRIVNDHALLLYRFPWESAVWPHMIFQLALTPLHAQGYPDAGNVASWGLHAMLIWFGWRLITAGGEIKAWGWLLLLCMATGIYPVIWDVTGGGYPMGELATAAIVVLLFSSGELLKKTGETKYTFLASFLMMCMVSTKVLMLPLGGIMMLLLAWQVLKPDFSLTRTGRFLMAAALPWVLFYLPILAWTFHLTGSPFGPALAGFLNFSSVYDPEQLQTIFAIDRIKNSVNLYDVFFNSAIYYPALLWVGVAYFFVIGKIRTSIRITALILVVCHALVLYFMVIPDTRFYGGLFQGFLLLLIPVLGSGAPEIIVNRRWVIATATLVLVVPWLSLQVFFGSQFFPVSLGIQDKHTFYREKIALYDDYLRIDRLLPEDAIILYSGDNAVRINSVYIPRPVYFRTEDLPPGKKPYLLTINLPKPGRAGIFTVDSLLYANPGAVTITYRNPFRSPVHGSICVYRLR